MAEEQHRIGLDLTYRGRFDALERDLKRLEALQERAEQRPIRVPIRIDTSGIRSQATAAAAEIRKSVQGALAQTGGGTTPGGIALPPGSLAGFQRSAKEAGDSIRSSLSTVYNGQGKAVSQIQEEVQQVERGFQRLTSVASKLDTVTGQPRPGTERTTVKETDTRNVERQLARLDAARAQTDKAIATAKRTGNADDELATLSRRYQDLSRVVNSTDFQKFTPTRELRKANEELARLQKNIGTLEGRRAKAAAKDDFSKRLGVFNKQVQANQKLDYGKLGGAAGRGDLTGQIDVLRRRAIALRSTLRSVSDRDIIDSQSFRTAEARLDALSQRISTLSGRKQNAEASRALNRQIKLAERRTQALLKTNLQERERAKAIADATARQQELNRVTARRRSILQAAQRDMAALQAQANQAQLPNVADKAERRGLGFANQENQVDLDAQRAANRKLSSDRETSLRRRLTLIEQQTRLRLKQLDQDLAQAKTLKTKARREAAINDILRKRRALLERATRLTNSVGSAAQRSGISSLADRATAQNARNTERMVDNQKKLATGTRKSGHALDFHSNQLLRNAATFAKWYGPMQLVLGAIQAVSALGSGAVRTDRQYATLQAVFQGTADEAHRLRTETLELAAANGRSNQEALESSIAFSRLNLTRVQVLTLVETALRAANVAEIAAGEATTKLTAIYKGFKLEVADVPGVLDRLNAISNRYAVTVKDLFEGISRTGAIAKQAGFELQDLEGVIAAVTQATGRPGQEIGNSLKFVITRLRRPETLNKLEEVFGLDLKDSTGEVQEFSDILARLAAIYPTLGRAQQAYFLDVVAGSRQANRLALVLDNYRTAQIVSARAAADSNSAQRENARILDSVSAKAARLTSVWEKLGITLGDKGGYRVAEEALTGLGDLINNMAARTQTPQRQVSLSPLSTAAREDVRDAIRIQRSMQQLEGRSPVAPKIALASRAVLNTPSFAQADVAELKATRAELQKIIAGGRKDFFRDDDTNAYYQKWAKRMLSTVNELIGDDESKQAQESIARTTERISDLRSEIDGLRRGSTAYRGLAKDLAADDADISLAQNSFNDLREIVEGIPGGYRAAAEASLEFDAAMLSGDRQRAIQVLLRLAGVLDSRIPVAMAHTQRSTAIALREMEAQFQRSQAEVERLNKEIANATTDSAYSDLSEELRNAQDTSKGLAAALRFLRQELEEIKPVRLTEGQDANVKTFLAASKRAATALGESLPKIGSGEGDNPERFFQREIRSAELRLRHLQSIRQATQAERDAGPISLQDQLDILGTPQNQTERDMASELQRRLALQEEFVNIVDLEITKEQQRLDLVRQEIADKREVLRLEQAFAAGQRGAAAGDRAFLVGRNDSEQRIAQARALSLITQDALTSVAGGPDLTAAEHLRQRGAALQREATIRSNIHFLEERQAAIAARRANLEFDIADALRKQSEEASKRLALASREDQLRAAALAAATAGRDGPIGLEEFSYLDQRNRQVAANLVPGAAPALLNDSTRSFAEEARRLDEETARIAGSLGNLRDTLTTLSERIDAILPPVPAPDTLGLDGRPLQDAAGPQNPLNTVDLNVGDININLDLSDQIAEIADTLNRQTQARLSGEIAEIRALVLGREAPNTAAAAAAN